MRVSNREKWKNAQREHRTIVVCRPDATFGETKTVYEYATAEIARRAAAIFIKDGYRVYSLIGE